MRGLVALAILVLPGTAVAAPGDFTCRNEAVQISCDGKGCDVETASFTPMGLSRTGRTLEICAYSGCWSGPVLVRRTQGSTSFLYARVRNTSGGAGGAGGGAAPLSVIFDADGPVALMRWGGFAQPMTCTVSSGRP